MSRRATPYDEAERIYKSRPVSSKQRKDVEKWQDYWREQGPIEFAYKVLRIDPNTGGPIQLSDDQKLFLIDLWKNGVRLAIISAGRGAGKTFILAVYIIWRIATHRFYNIESMGGSSEQSEKIQGFITGWRRFSPELSKHIIKDVQGKVRTMAHSECIFMSCSATSVRGPHTYDIIIDEECAGEERGNTKFIKAALWGVSTSPDIHIIKSSTAHYVHGDFLKTWEEGKDTWKAGQLVYKRYRWAIAKHINGKEDPKEIYMDTNPENWVSNVPWTFDRNIRIARKSASNDEWLVEALGGISIASGLVYNPMDIDDCICNKCKICEPFTNECPLLQYLLELSGVNPNKIPISTEECLKLLNEKVLGIDWGYVAESAYTLFARIGKFIVVLFSEELGGLSDREKIVKVDELKEKWGYFIIRPDPAQQPYNNELIDKGYTVHELFSFEGGQEKITYVYDSKRLVERHAVMIPKAFEALIRNLRRISYEQEKKGKVRKGHDHSFDSFIYGISYEGYREDDTQGDFWAQMAERREKEKEMEEKVKDRLFDDRESDEGGVKKLW